MIETISGFEIRNGIRMPVTQRPAYQRADVAGDQILQVFRDREKDSILLDIARVKAKLPAFNGLDAHKKLIEEQGAILPVKVLLEIRKSVQRVVSALPVSISRTVERRNFACPVQVRAAANSTDRRMTVRASTPTIDSYHTIVNPMGIRTERFSKNPLLCWSHDWAGGGIFGGTPDLDNAIGKAVSWSASPLSFDAVVEFDTSPRADEALRKARAGILNSVSIGFVPEVWHEESRDGRDIVVFDQVQLLEISLVMIGANEDALIQRSQKPARATHEY